MMTINLHGCLGEKIGNKWDLDVQSPAEAIRAINILTNDKLNHLLYENDKKGIKYEVLLNEKQFKTNKPLNKLTEESVNEIRNSELMIKNDKLKTMDIVPVIEGAGSNALGIILGILLIIVAIVFIQDPYFKTLVIAAGVALIAAGVINLLSSPPKFEEFTEGRKRTSYLFSGPSNTTREGGPVPVGYGRLIVGSHVISASYEITHIDAEVYKASSAAGGRDVGFGTVRPDIQ